MHQTVACLTTTTHTGVGENEHKFTPTKKYISFFYYTFGWGWGKIYKFWILFLLSFLRQGFRTVQAAWDYAAQRSVVLLSSSHITQPSLPPSSAQGWARLPGADTSEKKKKERNPPLPVHFLKFYLLFKLLQSLCVCIYIYAHMFKPQHTCRGVRGQSLKNQLFPSTMWAPGLELDLADFTACALTHWAISTAPLHCFHQILCHGNKSQPTNLTFPSKRPPLYQLRFTC